MQSCAGFELDNVWSHRNVVQAYYHYLLTSAIALIIFKWFWRVRIHPYQTVLPLCRYLSWSSQYLIKSNNLFQDETESCISQPISSLPIDAFSNTRKKLRMLRTWTTVKLSAIFMTTVLVLILKKILTVQQDNRTVS